MGNYPQNFIVGQNLQIVFQDDEGNIYMGADFGQITDFNLDPDDTLVKVIPITNGGRPISRKVPHGWAGTVTLSKYNGFLSDYIALQEAEFYNQGVQHFLTMVLNQQNVDGSVSQYTLTYVVLHKADFGKYSATKEVEQAFSFEAQELLSANVQGSLGGAQALASIPTTITGVTNL